MADIHITCPKCGTENTFSEYSLVDTRKCSKCETPLMAEELLEKKSLTLQNRKANQKVSLQGERIVDRAIEETQSSLDYKREKKEEKIKRPSFFLGSMVFLTLFIILVGAQYLSHPSGYAYAIRIGLNPNQIHNTYMWLRYVTLALGAMLILIDAFMESQFQGALCLIPPYMIWYALTRVGSPWKQGTFIAIVAMLVAEMYFLRPEAILTHVSQKVNASITYVEKALHDAGHKEVDRLK